MEKTHIRQAVPTDLQRIQLLLKDAGLPWEDVGEHLGQFVVAEADGKLIGTCGMEIRGSAGLLRSLAVISSHRNKGLGSMLYEQIIEQAKKNGIQQISLLTTTAERYFARKGFDKVEAHQIPQYVSETKEYQILCPSSEVCMIMNL